MKPIRVALSGSGTKVGAHIGALQAVVDAGYTIVELAGTSGGSIVSALYACGMPLPVMHDLALKMDWSSMMGMSPLSVMRLHGWCSGDNLLDFLCMKTHNKTFAELDIDLTIVASDISNEVPFLFSKKLTPSVPVSLAARSSASIPIVFAPIVMGDAVLNDGGLVVNLPVDLLTNDDIPRIGIELTGKRTPLKPGKYTLNKVIPHLIDLMIQSTEDAHISIGKMQGAVIAQVECGWASSLDRKMPLDIRQKLFDAGYAATKAALLGVTPHVQLEEVQS